MFFQSKNYKILYWKNGLKHCKNLILKVKKINFTTINKVFVSDLHSVNHPLALKSCEAPILFVKISFCCNTTLTLIQRLVWLWMQHVFLSLLFSLLKKQFPVKLLEHPNNYIVQFLCLRFRSVESTRHGIQFLQFFYFCAFPPPYSQHALKCWESLQVFSLRAK